MHLADHVDFVIGVDTHKSSHTLGLVDRTGAEHGDVTLATDAFGYPKMLSWAKERTADPERRCWAIEGTGSFGAGLTTYLLEHGEWVVEVDRPKRPARRNGAKSDTLDAYRAAREAFSREHLAQPRRRGTREAIRVLLCTREGAVRARSRALCHLQALIVNAPTQLRDQLRRDKIDVQVERCARLKIIADHSVEHRATVRVSAPPRDESRRSPPKPTTSKPNSRSSSPTPLPNCSPSPVSARSPPLRSSTPGPTRAGSVPRPRSRCCRAQRPYPHRQAKRSGTASTAAGTASSTVHSTPSCCHACGSTPKPRPTSHDASPKDEPHARSRDA